MVTSWNAERTRLWNEWLETPDGRRYEAGWGDDENRERAERGKAWVEEELKRDAPPSEPAHCNHCDGAKVAGEPCHGEDVCEYGPGGGKAQPCEGWGRYCCRCGAAFARNQM